MRNYIFALLLLCEIGFSQTNDSIYLKKSSVFIELLGNSVGLIGINYDRIITEYDNSYLNVTAGISPFIGVGSSYKYISIPVSINYTSFKRSSSHLELGVGLAYSYYKDEESNRNCCEREQMLFISRIGYKYQRPQGGFNFKIGLTPTFPLYIMKDRNDNTDLLYEVIKDIEMYLHFIGLALGYTF